MKVSVACLLAATSRPGDESLLRAARRERPLAAAGPAGLPGGGHAFVPGFRGAVTREMSLSVAGRQLGGVRGGPLPGASRWQQGPVPRRAAGFSQTLGQAGSLRSLVGPRGPGHAGGQLGSGLGAPAGGRCVASAPSALPSTETKQRLSRGGEAGLRTWGPLYPAEALPRAPASCTPAAGGSLCRSVRSVPGRRVPAGLCLEQAQQGSGPPAASPRPLAREVRSQRAGGSRCCRRLTACAGAKPSGRNPPLCRAHPALTPVPLRCVAGIPPRCRETPGCPACPGFPGCTDGAGQTEAEKTLRSIKRKRNPVS